MSSSERRKQSEGYQEMMGDYAFFLKNKGNQKWVRPPNYMDSDYKGENQNAWKKNSKGGKSRRSKKSKKGKRTKKRKTRY